MSTEKDPTPARVLVADDQPDVLEALRWLLTGEGYEPQFVSSTDGVMERLRAEEFDLLLMDLNYTRDTTSGREGLELIPRVRAHAPALPIVVMTGWGSIDTAVEAMRRGAKSFVQKPWEDVTLLEILRARDRGSARRAPPRSQAAARDRGGPADPARPAADRPCRRCRAWRSPSRGSPPTASAATASTRSASATCSACRSPTSPERAAGRAPDVEPAGGGPRVRAGIGAPVVDLRQRQSSAVPQHGERPLRDVLLRAHRRARPAASSTRTPDTTRRCRPGRRRRGDASPKAAWSSACFPKTVTNRASCRSDAAIASCSTPTASPRRAAPTAKRTGEDRLTAAALSSRSAPVEPMKDALLADVNAFTGGQFEDDATMIVVGIA